MKLLQAWSYLPCVSWAKSLCQPDSLYTETCVIEYLPPVMMTSFLSWSGMEQASLSEIKWRKWFNVSLTLYHIWVENPSPRCHPSLPALSSTRWPYLPWGTPLTKWPRTHDWISLSWGWMAGGSSVPGSTDHMFSGCLLPHKPRAHLGYDRLSVSPWVIQAGSRWCYLRGDKSQPLKNFHCPRQ